MKLSEFLTALNNRIAAAKVSGFWTDAQKEQWIYESVVRVCNWQRWKNLELAKSTTTKANQEYYDYPAEFKANSIYYMEVDGKEYIEKTWDDYQAFRAAGSTDKIFSSHNGFYFINPTPATEGLTIDIWGIKKPVALATWKAADNDSVLAEEFDEAIIKMALATCLDKERRKAEATAERNEVERPANPRIEGSGGILAKLAAREEDEGPKGYIGKAKSTRFMM